VTAIDTAVGAQSLPGTNLKGAVGGANWCYLLPRLELGRVLSLGSPSPSAIVTLSNLADEVAVWAESREHERLRRLFGRDDLRNISLLASEGGSLPIPDGAIDVVLLAKARLVHSRLRPAAPTEIERVLKPDGLLYAESHPLLERWLARRAPRWSFERLGGGTTLWIAPAFDEMRLAAPLSDRGAIEYLDRRFLKPIFRRELVKHPRRVLARSVVLTRSLRRRAVVASAAGDASLEGLPEYVRAIAASSGAAVDGFRWALAAPGDYNSQKVLLFLFGEREEQPQAIVKIPRDAGFNERLENEWRALRYLEERGICADGTYPSPLFIGRHAGLAILGQTALVGAPFQRCLKESRDPEAGGKVVDWLVELGVATSHRPHDASLVADRLQGLLDRFDEVYRPSRDTVTFLADKVAAVAAGRDALRLVFQHGDPGPWNLLVTPDGKPAFLDWEAADPDGLPLWDLFHFLRSFGFAISKTARRHDHVRSFAEQMLDASELNRLLVEATSRYCRELPLSPRLVEPLFYLCWMHRAVKEASRLREDRLQTGRYVTFLGLAVEQRDAPGLRRLFSLPAAV
jgi:hypothetical protein